MKTTIEIDEEKLKRVMELTGVKTKREAVDLALSELERMRKLKKILSKPFNYGKLGDSVFDPNYDLMKLREMDKPKYGADY